MAEKATNQDWLDQVQEEALEPELPIIDPHHHLWDQKVGRVNPKYFLEEMLEDTNSGHNIVATVFIECGAMLRADSPDHLKPLGETEFVNGIAAQSASGIYGPTRVAAGIVGTMDWRRGAGRPLHFYRTPFSTASAAPIASSSTRRRRAQQRPRARRQLAN